MNKGIEPAEMDEYKVCTNKDSQWYCWEFWKHPDGQWVSCRKLSEIELKHYTGDTFIDKPDEMDEYIGNRMFDLMDSGLSNRGIINQIITDTKEACKRDIEGITLYPVDSGDRALAILCQAIDKAQVTGENK